MSVTCRKNKKNNRMGKYRNISVITLTIVLAQILSGCSCAASMGMELPSSTHDVDSVWHYTIISALESPYGGDVLIVWVYAILSAFAYILGRTDDIQGKYHSIWSHDKSRWYSWTDYSDGPIIPNGSKERGNKYVAWVGFAIVFCFLMYYVVNAFNMTNALQWVIAAIVIIVCFYFIRPLVQPFFKLLAMICWGTVAIDFAIGLVMGLSCIKLP